MQKQISLISQVNPSRASLQDSAVKLRPSFWDDPTWYEITISPLSCSLLIIPGFGAPQQMYYNFTAFELCCALGIITLILNILRKCLTHVLNKRFDQLVEQEKSISARIYYKKRTLKDLQIIHSELDEKLLHLEKEINSKRGRIDEYGKMLIELANEQNRLKLCIERERDLVSVKEEEYKQTYEEIKQRMEEHKAQFLTKMNLLNIAIDEYNKKESTLISILQKLKEEEEKTVMKTLKKLESLLIQKLNQVEEGERLSTEVICTEENPTASQKNYAPNLMTSVVQNDQ